MLMCTQRSTQLWTDTHTGAHNAKSLPSRMQRVLHPATQVSTALFLLGGMAESTENFVLQTFDLLTAPLIL